MAKNKANEEKKRYLMRYQDSVKQLEFCSHELARVATLETQITPSMTGMPQGQPDGSKTEIAVERADAAAQKYKVAIAEHQRILDEITATLKGQLTGKALLVMQWRYIAGAGWETVAERVGISLRWVWALHGQALETLVLPQQWDEGGQRHAV